MSYLKTFALFLMICTMGDMCQHQQQQQLQYRSYKSNVVGNSILEQKIPSSVIPTSVYQPFAGLANVGHTCYMNAVLQIVAALYGRDVEEDPLKELINRINSGHEPLGREDMQDFKNDIIRSCSGSGTIKELFIKGNDKQQDSHEFMLALDEYYKFLGTCTFHTRIWIKESKEGRERLLYRDRQSTEIEKVISLPLEKDCVSTLSELIKQYIEECVTDANNRIARDENDRYEDADLLTNKSAFIDEKSKELSSTPVANGQYPYIKQSIFENLPNQLCILLKRFLKNDDEIATKIITPVKETAHIHIASDPNIPDKAIRYALNGFILHGDSNSVNSGHYVAYVKRKGQWYKASDPSIEEISAAAAIADSEKAYLLFYEKQ